MVPEHLWGSRAPMGRIGPIPSFMAERNRGGWTKPETRMWSDGIWAVVAPDGLIVLGQYEERQKAEAVVIALTLFLLVNIPPRPSIARHRLVWPCLRLRTRGIRSSLPQMRAEERSISPESRPF